MSLRQSGGKKGAPKGHDGHTLPFTEHPDEIVVHQLTTCAQCAASLADVESVAYEKRQVFDLPAPSIKVTKHRTEKKKLRCLRTAQTGGIPGTSNAVWGGAGRMDNLFSCLSDAAARTHRPAL